MFYIQKDRLLLSIKMLIEKAGYKDVPSFSYGPFFEEEHYKCEVYAKANKLLDYRSWNVSDIGSGRILACVRKAVEANGNLINYMNKHLEGKAGMDLIEEALFNLYRSDNDENSFNELIRVLPKKTDLISYLFFLKNDKEYLPCRSRKFEIRLSYMGIATNCLDNFTWKNYREFIEIIQSVRSELQPFLSEKVTLLDAHSFVWMQWHLKDEYMQMEPLCHDYTFSAVKINKDQWIQMIEDGTLNEKDIQYLAKYYASPHHMTSHARLGALEGKSSHSYTSRCTSIANRVLKKCGIKEFEWSNGQFNYFPICFLGRYSFDGHYEWQLRSELAEALEEACSFQVDSQTQTMIQWEEKEAEELPVDKLMEKARNYHGGPASVYISKTPQRRRNPILVRAAKVRAAGICQLCGNMLDYLGQDGLPYLEAHHIVPLAEEGPDDLSNMVALCPNCHTRMHVLKDLNDIERLKVEADKK